MYILLPMSYTLLFFIIALTRRRQEGAQYDEQNDEFLERAYTIRFVNRVDVPLFQTFGRDYVVHMSPEAFPDGIMYEECIIRLYRIFQGVINDLLGDLPDEAHARIIIMPAQPDDDDIEALQTPVSTSYQRVRLITPELIIAKIENIGQSKRKWMMTNQMKIHVVHTIPPHGNGRKIDCTQLREKSSIISVCKYDNRCLAEAIVLGRYIHEHREYILNIYIVD